MPALRLVVSAGEACNASLAQSWSAGRRFVNAYGPTEATVCATFGDHQGPAAPTIGTPFAGTEAHVLGTGLDPLAVGLSGEIHLAGVGLARGYRNRPSATAEAFIPNPFGAPGSRLYRSRDLGRRRADNRLLHLGRTDHQVKLRGYRIELGEIESALAGHARIAQATVLVRTVAGAGDQLVAYLTLRQEAREQPTQATCCWTCGADWAAAPGTLRWPPPPSVSMSPSWSSFCPWSVAERC
ncbi:AMP-binding protein [Streptomyces sp. NPDC088923]|uniref:AMP-binding protein n=1 Tax=Streptomyces sp. NPDC088923 TaxID=3365913 RepID=UPI00381B6E31